MRLIIFLLGITTLASAFTGYLGELHLDDKTPDPRQGLLTQDDKGNFKYLNLKDTRLEMKATLDDLSYDFYTRNSQGLPTTIINNNVSMVPASEISIKNRPIFFIIHGWNNDRTSPVNTLLMDALLGSYDVNIFVVDWGRLAACNYFTSKNAVPVLGNFIGDFINDIVTVYDRSFKDFTLIGHSLGAHMAGAAGRGKVEHITGLDPAQPMFAWNDITDRLDPSDATFVRVIHTCAGYLGFTSPIGHADYYPNGGSSQPGCWMDFVGTCAHSRSYMYLADSIKDHIREFLASECDCYNSYLDGKCNDTKKSNMGGIYPDRSASGSYYLKTRSEEPYGEYFPLQHSRGGPTWT